MFDLAKIFFAQPEKRRAIEFGVAADVVIGVRMQLVPVGVPPKLFGVVAALRIHLQRVPVFFLARHEWPALEQENLLAARSEVVRQSAAACAGTDDDEIVMAIIHMPIRRHECQNPYTIQPEERSASLKLLEMAEANPMICPDCGDPDESSR